MDGGSVIGWLLLIGVVSAGLKAWGQFVESRRRIPGPGLMERRARSGLAWWEVHRG